MLSKNFINHLRDVLSTHLNQSIPHLKFTPVYGGSINQCFALTAGENKWFMKANSASEYPNMLETEFTGMNLLDQNSSFKIPKMLICQKFEDIGYLVMEFIENGHRLNDYWEVFGRRLGEMHRNTYPRFGLDHDNYIGSLKQSNHQKENWSDFFIEERLIPQLNNSIEILSLEIRKGFDEVFKKIEQIFPSEKPALIHGDLWSGNFMTSENGEATIFDPSVYYGHREMDIAMTKLFGGFESQFYESYNGTYPLEPGWQDRIDICNLYPLLVHVNLFGGGYINQVRSILKRYA